MSGSPVGVTSGPSAVATVRGMTAWAAQGVELPFGDAPRSWWIDASGSLYGRTAASTHVVTYHHDPGEDPDQLAGPAAVVAGGIRLR